MSSHSIYNLFVFGTGSFVLGVYTYLFSTKVHIFLASILFCLCGIFFYTAITNKYRVHVFVFLLCCFLCGSFRLYVSREKDVSFNRKNETILGTIVSNPIDTQYGQSFEVKVEKEGKILLRSSSHDRFLYGDRISFKSKCESPENFNTVVGTEFDYQSYLKKNHILSICKGDSTLLKERPKFSFRRVLFSFSNFLTDTINTLFKEPESGIVSGMLFGNKSSISSEIQTNFTKTGTIHLLALSGYNIALVAFFFQRIFELLIRRKYALLMSMFSVIVFVLMTGASASAVRAGGMIFILILGKLLYKEYSSLRALFIVAACMIFLEPYTLLYDASFHLSFLATFGIILVEPIMRKILSFLKFKPLILIFSVSLGAQIMTLPYILYAFNSLSLSSFVTNSIIAPFVPIVMFLGTLSLFLGILYIPLSGPLVLLTQSLVSYMLELISYFASIKNGFFVFIKVPLTLIIFIYVIILVLIFRFYLLKYKFTSESKKVDL